MSEKRDKLQGFTLIEILVVVALIAILAAVTIVAINPGKNFADTRNATRSADVASILNAVTQYTSEEGNALTDLCGGCADFPDCDDVGEGETVIGDPTDAGCVGCIDLDAYLVDEYLVAIPTDPQDDGTYANGTGYTICETGSGRIQINAPSAEDKTITVLR